MAYLVECSKCRRKVSNECKFCPGCGNNVKKELLDLEKLWDYYLTKCPLCGQENVRSDCEACPSCGHNVKKDLLEQNMYKQKRIARENQEEKEKKERQESGNYFDQFGPWDDPRAVL